MTDDHQPSPERTVDVGVWFRLKLVDGNLAGDADIWRAVVRMLPPEGRELIVRNVTRDDVEYSIMSILDIRPLSRDKQEVWT